jgi:hypothetical protein
MASFASQPAICNWLKPIGLNQPFAMAMPASQSKETTEL